MIYIVDENLLMLQAWSIQCALNVGIKPNSGTIYFGSGFENLVDGTFAWKLTQEETKQLPETLKAKLVDEVGELLVINEEKSV